MGRDNEARLGSGRAATRAGRRSRERRVLPQHGPLEFLQPRTRVNPELLAEQNPDLPVNGERFALAGRPVQSQHQLPAQPLAQRVPGDQRLQLRHQLLVAAEREFGLHALLSGGAAQLLKSAHVRVRERLELNVGERTAAPQRLRLPQLDRSEFRVPGLKRTLPASRQPLEAGEVELIGSDAQHVSRRQGDEPSPAIAGAGQCLAQPRHVGIKRVAGGLGRPLSPERIDQAVP